MDRQKQPQPKSSTDLIFYTWIWLTKSKPEEVYFCPCNIWLCNNCHTSKEAPYIYIRVATKLMFILLGVITLHGSSPSGKSTGYTMDPKCCSPNKTVIRWRKGVAILKWLDRSSLHYSGQCRLVWIGLVYYSCYSANKKTPKLHSFSKSLSNHYSGLNFTWM